VPRQAGLTLLMRAAFRFLLIHDARIAGILI
jgi:hypothetical protein